MIYTRADIKARINAGIKNKVGLLTDANETINDVVRAVNSEFDLRSTRRMVAIQPGIFDEVLAYPAPADLKAQRLVSLSNQADPQNTYVGFNLIPYEQFNQKLGHYNRYTDGRANELEFADRELYTVAFDDINGLRRMMISAPQDGTDQVLTSLDNLTAGGGLWTSFGDAINVDTDTGNYIRGNGSIKFDIDAAGGPTAGIYNATMDPFDLTTFLATNSAYFDFMYLSNVEGVNSIVFRAGQDAANCYEITITATHVNTVFQVGWNTLRFDAINIVEIGTPAPEDCVYMALYMNKEATKISESTFRFDHVVARTGTVMNLRYYSKFAWQTQAGVWLENSTEDDDFMNLESDEYDMVIDKGIMVAGMEVDETTAAGEAGANYNAKLKRYKAGNPSEALVETSDYQAQYYI